MTSSPKDSTKHWALAPARLLLSPGFLAIALHRIAHAVYPHTIAGRVAAKIIWRINVLLTGCHISPKARIGARLQIPHATGVVIGDGCIIGDDVTVYQNVTLGHKNDAYPHIANGAAIYPGAVVLGGITVGEHAVVGANAVVLADVPAHAYAVGVPARIIKMN
jgi:serine O-acetyltransferase